MLCQKCSNITFSLQTLGYGDSKHDYLEYKHYETFALLRSSARSCHLCRQVAYEATKPEHPPYGVDAEEMMLAAGPVYVRGTIGRDFKEKKSRLSSLSFDCKEVISLNFVIVDEDLYEVSDKWDMAQYSDDHLLSPENINLTRQWMSHCSGSHYSCSSKASLPLWVIEISASCSGVTAKLVQGQGRAAHYATLSYKWGNAVRYMLTSSNNAQLRQQIPLESIPRTFADAIRVAHKLGYSYLWIDALCITQDAEAELQQQINIMQDIYAGSDLTIFAAAGDNAEAGLDRKRDAINRRPLRLTYRMPIEYDSVNVSVTMYKRRWWDEYPLVDDVFRDKLPLFQRGWVLQEEILSRRAVTFTTTEITWRCLHDDLTERFPFRRRLPRYDSRYDQDYRGVDVDKLTKSRNWVCARPKSYGDFDEVLMALHQLIEVYCARQLTYESDVLSAVSGLMSVYAERLNSTFVEGVCIDSIRGMLWNNDDTNIARQKPIVDRPSWSWTSQFGCRLSFWRTKLDTSKNMQISLAPYTNNSLTKLTVKSWTRWANLKHNGNGVDRSYYLDLPDGRYEEDENLKCYPDNAYSLLDPSKYPHHVLCIFATHFKDREDDRGYAFIVTVPHPEIPNCFTRLGIGQEMNFRGPDPDFFGDMNEIGAVLESRRRVDGPDYTIQNLI